MDMATPMPVTREAAHYGAGGGPRQTGTGGAQGGFGMRQRDLAAEIAELRARRAQLERCLAALQEAVTEITDELDPPAGSGRDLMRVFGGEGADPAGREPPRSRGRP